MVAIYEYKRKSNASHYMTIKYFNNNKIDLFLSETWAYISTLSAKDVAKYEKYQKIVTVVTYVTQGNTISENTLN